MLRQLPILRFASKIVVQGISAVLASITGAYLLTALHLRPDSGDAAPSLDNTAAEERAMTREYLKAMREPHEAPAEVAARPAPSEPAEAAENPAIGTMAPAAAETAVAATAPANATPTAATAGTVASTPRVGHPDAADANTAPPGSPMALSPITVAAPVVAEAKPVDQQSEPQRVEPPAGLGGKVFSAVSMILGTAANVTGDSINFVIELPGKAVAAGDKLVRGEGQATQSQQPRPQPSHVMQYSDERS
jgi:hypothetical protein